MVTQSNLSIKTTHRNGQTLTLLCCCHTQPGELGDPSLSNRKTTESNTAKNQHWPHCFSFISGCLPFYNWSSPGSPSSYRSLWVHIASPTGTLVLRTVSRRHAPIRNPSLRWSTSITVPLTGLPSLYCRHTRLSTFSAACS